MIAHLYIISEGPDGPVKIGRTISAPSARLASLQTGNPRPLHIYRSYVLPCDEVIAAERELHEELNLFGLIGEWFEIPESFIDRYMPDFFLSNGFEPLR